MIGKRVLEVHGIPCFRCSSPGFMPVALQICVCAQFNFLSSNRWEGPQNQGWMKGWALAGWEVSSPCCLDIPNYTYLAAYGTKKNCLVCLNKGGEKKEKKKACATHAAQSRLAPTFEESGSHI